MNFMITIQSAFRATIIWLLAGSLGIVIPLQAAQQPGVLASNAPIVIQPIHNFTGIAALPRTTTQDQQQTTSPAATGASPAPAKHRLPTWAWVAIVAGAGVAIGAGVLAANSQSGKTSAAISTTTIGAGGTITAGAP